MPSPRARRLVYGKADAGRSAELRFLALSPQSLVIQIRDSRPDKAKPASWVGADHLEIWTLLEPGDSYLPDPTKLAQLGIGLDGTTYAGTGKAPVPQIQRWTAKDEQGRPVTVMKLDWSEEVRAGERGHHRLFARGGRPPGPALGDGSHQQEPAGLPAHALRAARRLRRGRRKLGGDEESRQAERAGGCSGVRAAAYSTSCSVSST